MCCAVSCTSATSWGKPDCRKYSEKHRYRFCVSCGMDTSRGICTQRVQLVSNLRIRTSNRTATREARWPTHTYTTHTPCMRQEIVCLGVPECARRDLWQ